MREAQSKRTLAVVGTGIQAGRQLTRECESWLKMADKIVYCVSEHFTRDLIVKLRPDADDLSHFYEDGQDRRKTYDKMIDRTMELLYSCNTVCAAFYGHPGVYVSPSHEAVLRARAEGFRAFMLPGISTEACLYADLGIDPADHGCLSYEASEWLVFRHSLDPTVAVILWQVDCVGDVSYRSERYDGRHVPLLVKALLKYYPPSHVAYLYQAAMLPVSRPRVWPVEIGRLAEVVAEQKTAGTLYIPPHADPPVDLDMARRLGIEEDNIEMAGRMPVWALPPSIQVPASGIS